MTTNVGAPFGMSAASDVSAGGVRRDEGRGRKMHRDPAETAMTDENMEHSPDEQVGTSRKRRRSKKGLDKKFNCTAPKCGKSYSRAEHLYRHQLNRK